MAALIHEIWESIEDGMILHTCCFAGSLGNSCRETLPKSSRLLSTFVAGSHFDAMTIYHQYLGRESYTTNHPEGRLPYPADWFDKQQAAEEPSNLPANDVIHGEFGEAWFELGIVNNELILQLIAQRDDDDHHPEHLRYAAFRRFVELNQPINNERCWELYRLGSTDPDVAMGGSIMADILRLTECPSDLLRFARGSDRKHIARIAEQRLPPEPHNAANKAVNPSGGSGGF